MVRQRNLLRRAFLVCTVPAVTRDVGSSDVRSASGRISLNRSDLHAVPGDMRRPENVIIAGIAPQEDRRPAVVDVGNCAKRNLRASDSGYGRVRTQDQDWERTSTVSVSVIGGKIEIGGQRCSTERLRYADVEVARRGIATVLPDGIDADPSVGSFHSEYIFGWEYERPLDPCIGLPFRIEQAVRE